MQVRTNRQESLCKLLKSKAFFSQSEIVAEMRAQGYEVTQPSISRDFKQLGVLKFSGGRYLPTDPRSTNNLVANGETAIGPATDTTAHSYVVSTEAVGANMVVVKTEAGAANVVAAKMDSENLNGVAGTIAGDDTIFVAVRNKDAQRALLNIFKVK